MGLREMNAARTHELILEAALELFVERGYDATTMEDVAEHAGVGTSTLYRYFPTKDQLVLEPLSFHDVLAPELRARPAEESLDVALGHCLVALLSKPRADAERLRQVELVFAGSTALQARLGEVFNHERAALAAAIAERLDRPATDPYCVVTAGLTTMILELAAERHPDDPIGLDEAAVVERAGELMRTLASEPPATPRLT